MILGLQQLSWRHAPWKKYVEELKKSLSHKNSEFVKKGLRRRQIHNRFTLGLTRISSIAENQVGVTGTNLGATYFRLYKLSC